MLQSFLNTKWIGSKTKPTLIPSPALQRKFFLLCLIWNRLLPP